MTQLINRLSDLRRNNRGRAKLMIDFFDVLFAALSFPVAFWLTREFLVPGLQLKIVQTILFLLLAMMSWFVLARVTNMAKVPRTARYRTIAAQLTRITYINFLVLGFSKYIFFFTSIPFGLIVIYVTLMFFVNLGFRIVVYKALKKYRIKGHSLHNVIVIADGFSDSIIHDLANQVEWGFRIKYILSSSKLIRAKYGDTYTVLEEFTDLKPLLDNEVIDEVIHTKKHISQQRVAMIANICDEVGVIFRMQSTVSPIDPIHFQLQSMNNEDDRSLVDAPANDFSLLMKNMSDIYFSLLAIILLTPALGLLAILIKIDSKGPVFFKQERIGLRGRKFGLYKFRTMVTNAEDLLAQLQEENEADGPVFKIKDDPRITKIGRILRKTGMDELPQLFNVIRGEMSLIGPRPPLEKEVDQYERWQLKRLSVKPGITCTWQVVPDRHDVSFEQWMELDMKYIKDWSISKDIGLFFKTLKALISAGGH